MIELTIDGKRVKAKKGETVLTVAQRQGIRIPTLCHHEALSPYGGCRLCVVEVKGLPRPVASCTLPADNGMVVHTNTPMLKKLRRFTIGLIMSEHPHACLICKTKEDCKDYQECIQKSAITFGCKFCPQNDQCELQAVVEELEIESIPFNFLYRNLEVERFDPFFDRDYNLCILCGRCVRACEEVRNAATLDFHHRGPDTLVGTAFALSHLETDCQFCGACVDVCPTGALKERFGRYDGPPDRSVRTRCVLCGLGCSVNLNLHKNTIIGTSPDKDQICVRGRFGIAPIVHHPKRITKPLVRKGDRIVEVEWDEALAAVSSGLVKHKGKTGMMVSPQLTVEALDLANSLADRLSCEHLSTSSEPISGFQPVNFKKISKNPVYIIYDTDLIRDFSPFYLKLRTRSKERPVFIVIDEIGSKLSDRADCWLKPDPGKSSDVIKLLFSKARVNNTTGIPAREIELAKGLLKGRAPCVIYNLENSDEIRLPKSVQKVPLTSHINTRKIVDMGIGYSNQTLLGNREISCLYLIGAAPKLERDYKMVIVQDCFPPPFEFDIFLPAATFTESGGTYINVEGKEIKIRRGIKPLDQSKPDNWIFNQIAKKLGFDLTQPKPKKRKGISPPLKRGKTNKDYPIRMIVRDNGYVYRGHTLSEWLKGFKRLRVDGFVMMNDATAKKLKMSGNSRVRVIGRNLDISMPVNLTDVVSDDCILVYRDPSLGINNSQPVRLECIKS